MSSQKAIGYIRFSTKEQGADGRRSYDRQWKKIESYAETQGLELVKELYLDYGVSAFRGSNKKASLGELLSKAESGEIAKGSVIITESMDRLGREKALDQILFIKNLVDTGVRLAVLDSGKLYKEDSLHDVMELMFAVMSAGRNNQESQEKSDRITDVWEDRRKKAEEGIITSGNLPCWLKQVDSRAVVIEERAEIIRSIYEMSAHQNMGVYAIRNALNDNPDTQYWGHPSRVGKRDAHVWRHSFITRVLKDVSVLGWWHAHERLENGKRKPIGEPIKGAYPQIISEDLFNLAKSKMAKRYVKRESGRRGKSLYQNFYRKIGYCDCGSRLHFEQKGRSRANNPNGDKPLYRYLTCFERCGRMPVNYPRAEEILLNSLNNYDMTKVIFGENEKREVILQENELTLATIEEREAKLKAVKADYASTFDSDKAEILMEVMLDLKKEIKALKGKVQEVPTLSELSSKDRVNFYNFDISSADEENRRKVYEYILDTVERVTVVQLDKCRSYAEVELKNGVSLFHSIRLRKPRGKASLHFCCLSSQVDWSVHEWQSELVDTMVIDEDGFLEDFKEPKDKKHRLDVEIEPVLDDSFVVAIGDFGELDDAELEKEGGSI